MLDNILAFLHGATILAFGALLTVSFAGIHSTKKNLLVLLGFYFFSGGLQLTASLTISEEIVWKLYPFITHLPLILLLYFVYRKPLATAAASVFTSYLCCQPSKWFGVLVSHLTNSATAEVSVRILCLIPVGYVAIALLAPFLSEMFNKNTRSVCISGFVPTIYYGFDYVTAVYTDLWLSNDRVVMEFLPFLLAVMYMAFCLIYYKEYEQKADAQRKEQIIRIAVDQQAKEIETVRQTEKEIRYLRHDMRLLLSSLAVSIENGDTASACEMIDAHIARIDGTKLNHYCSNDIVNSVISDYAARCRNLSVSFTCSVSLETLPVDEIMFSSILSNALDNALNAQRLVPPDRRNIKLTLKNSGSKLLLSVKNPIGRPVVFSDGYPVSKEHGHGYGTQSIRYLTERLGGNCQFSVQDNVFIFRAVL